jgi:hypothetical protein
MEFDSLYTAEYEAASAATEIERDRMPKGAAREITIKLRNEHRKRVLTVTVSMEIHRVEPAPQPARARQ